MVANSSSPSGSSKHAESQAETIIHDIARHAIAYDKVLEATDVDFRVDERGNVVVVEPESQMLLGQSEKAGGFGEDKLIIVPRQEAYERITYAAHKKGEQLRGVYDLAQKQAGCWSRCAWIAAMVATVGSLLTVFATVVLNISQEGHCVWLLLLMGINIGNMIIMACSLWRARYNSRQASLYLDNFLEIGSFCEVLNMVSELPVDSVTRRRFQEIIIAQSLGLQHEDIEMQDEDAISYFSR